MPYSNLGRRLLLSRLEAIVSKHVYNNNNPIRYPLSFSNDRSLRGANTILDVTDIGDHDIRQGHYRFGANHLMIMQALEEIVEWLEHVGYDYINVAHLEYLLAEGEVDA